MLEKMVVVLRTEHFKYGELVMTWVDDEVKSATCTAIVVCMVRGYNPSENYYIIYTPVGQRECRRVYDVWEMP